MDSIFNDILALPIHRKDLNRKSGAQSLLSFWWKHGICQTILKIMYSNLMLDLGGFIRRCTTLLKPIH